MDFDKNAAMNCVLNVVRKGDVVRGTTNLFKYCKNLDPKNRIWKKLSKIDFDTDSKSMARNLERQLAKHQMPAEMTGIYFGLDGLNMADSEGIQLGCAPVTRSQRASNEWADNCEFFLDDIQSKAFSQIYRTAECGSLADYVVALGYLGLAIRTAIESIQPQLLLGKAKQRFVCWGFHDGELITLGTVTRKGLTLQLPDPTPIRKFFKTILPRIRVRRPRKSGMVGWFQRAEEYAYLISTPTGRAEALATIAADYCSCGEVAAAERLLQDLVTLSSKGMDIRKNSHIQWCFGNILWDMRESRKRIVPRILISRSVLKEHRERLNERNVRVRGAVSDELAVANWRNGQKTKYRRMLKRLFNLDLVDDPHNSHMTMDSFEGIARIQNGVGDTKGINRTMLLARAFVARTEKTAMPKPWQRVAVYGGMAVIADMIGDERDKVKYLLLAEYWANRQRGSRSAASLSSTAWLAMHNTYLELQDYENAIRAASRIPNTETRRETVAVALGMANRDRDAEGIVAKCKTAEEKMKLAQLIGARMQVRNDLSKYRARIFS